jgi:hypothetical protein
MRKTLQELRYKCGRHNTDSAIPDTAATSMRIKPITRQKVFWLPYYVSDLIAERQQHTVLVCYPQHMMQILGLGTQFS